IAAVQNEFSLLYRAEAEETLRTTRELKIGFVAYSPLGRGLLTGVVEDTTKWRKMTRGGGIHVSPPRTSPPTWRWSSASRRSRPGRTARRASSSWRGYWRRATTLCRSRAPSARRGFTKILARCRFA